MNTELTTLNEVLLIGGTHDGKRMSLPPEVGEVRLPMFNGLPGTFLHESYRRVYLNIFAVAGMDDEDAIRMLVHGYRSRGTVEFGVVEVEATVDSLPVLSQPLQSAAS